jgi:hypothetical protein
VRQGRVSGYPARLVDIAPTIEYLLGAQTGRADGVVLADAMTHPRPQQVAAQRKQTAGLLRVVLALRARTPR